MRDDRRAGCLLFLLIASVIASAFCLFLVQPLLAKQILPWFGGTASVWAVCMVFYQAALLAGYLYAHALTKSLKPRYQAIAHMSLVAVSLFSLPIGIQGLAKPNLASGSPSWQIVLLLAAAVGAPYFVLSATSPLMQAWYARLQPEGKAYRLFGWSNLACALALVSFPFVLEPLVGLSSLNLWWSCGYGVTAALLLGAGAIVARRNPERAHQEAQQTEPPRWAAQLGWLFFAALGSMLLLGVTNYLCQTVAPIPFLWTLPLLLYLLTFVVCFEREWYARTWGTMLAGAALLGMAWAIVFVKPGQMLALGIPIFAAGCFFGCLFCHGELASRKPDAAHLTHFYIVLAAGGALGSSLIAFGAPMVFRSYAELPTAMALVAVAMLFTGYGRSARTDAAAAACAVLMVALPVAYGMKASRETAASRNFYGSLMVSDQPSGDGQQGVRKMVHGAIAHGSQFLDAERGAQPTTYYGPLSGPGICLRNTQGPLRVGVVGLGVGTLATYGKPGDVYRFYEINPRVVEYARRYFTYLKDSAAEVQVSVGDGRLLLESEAPQSYDLLVVDAFSGDSIPMHLLTKEAFALYRRHLKPGGVLALHLSNMYLDLQPVVASLAETAGLASVPVLDSGRESEGVSPSSWALLGRPQDLARLGVKPRQVGSKSHIRPWTDDRSSLLGALK